MMLFRAFRQFLFCKDYDLNICHAQIDTFFTIPDMKYGPREAR